MPAITPPVPALTTSQPAAGSTATLEIARAYDDSGVVVASPVLAFVPVLGDAQLTITPQSTMYDTYVVSNLEAWSYAVKTGNQGSLTFKTAAPGTDTVVGPLVKGALKAGNAALAIFRLKMADGTYFSGTCVLGVAPSSPVRGIQEYTFTCPTSGSVLFTNA